MANNINTINLDQSYEAKVVRKLSVIGIVGNIILACGKLLAGIFGHSGAMISDAIHSFSDVFATFIAYVGVTISKKENDCYHQYGYERVECLASLILGLVLFVTGVLIGKNGVMNILSGAYKTQLLPSTIALVAAVISIVSKELMFWYTRHYAQILNSPAFMADAWHHRTDAFSSVGSLIGVAGAMVGFPIMDSVASVVICVFILIVAVDILIDSLGNMIDTSCGDDYEKQVCETILSIDGVEKIDELRTRRFGNKVYVDLEIAVDKDISFIDAHNIAEVVHDKVESDFADIKHVMIHVNPVEKTC